MELGAGMAAWRLMVGLRSDDFVPFAGGCFAGRLEIAYPDQYFLEDAQVDIVKNEFAVSVVADKIGFFQNGQVAGDGGSGDAEMLRNFSGRHGAVFKYFQNFTARGVSQGPERMLQGSWIIHFTFNFIVKYF